MLEFLDIKEINAMGKRIIALVLAFVLMLAMSACSGNSDPVNTGSNETSGNNQTESTGKPDNNEGDSKIELSQSLMFAGYNIYYPVDASKNSSDYGNLLGNEKYCLLVEAPSTAGVVLNTTKLSEAPGLCEQYVFETLEHKVRSLFDFDSTTQSTTSSEEVTYNGVKMLLIDGEFTNTKTSKKITYSAIYLLAGDSNNIPVYIVGVPMTDGENVTAIVKAMAQKISK